MQHLAQALCQSKEITPISLKNTEHVISLYADNILLYVDNVSQWLVNTLKIIDQIGIISNYGMYLTKSALLPLNAPMEDPISPYGITIVSHFTVACESNHPPWHFSYFVALQTGIKMDFGGVCIF